MAKLTRRPITFPLIQMSSLQLQWHYKQLNTFSTGQTGHSFHPLQVTPTETSHLFTWQRDASNVCLQGLRHRFLPARKPRKILKTSKKKWCDKICFKATWIQGDPTDKSTSSLQISDTHTCGWLVLYIGFFGLVLPRSPSLAWMDPPDFSASN